MNQSKLFQDDLPEIMNDLNTIHNAIKTMGTTFFMRFNDNEKSIWSRLAEIQNTPQKNLLAHQIKHLSRLGENILTEHKLSDLKSILQDIHERRVTIAKLVRWYNNSLAKVKVQMERIKDFVNSFNAQASAYCTKTGEFSQYLQEYISPETMQQRDTLTRIETNSHDSELRNVERSLRNRVPANSEIGRCFTKLMALLQNNQVRITEALRISIKISSNRLESLGPYYLTKEAKIRHLACLTMDSYASMFQLLNTYPKRNAAIEKKFFNFLIPNRNRLNANQINAIKKTTEIIDTSDDPHMTITNKLRRLFRNDDINKIAEAVNVTKTLTESNAHQLDALFFDKFDDLMQLIKTNFKYLDLQAKEFENLYNILNESPSNSASTSNRTNT